MKWVSLLVFLLICNVVFGQKEWRARGSFEFQSDLYSFKSNSQDLNGRRPDALNRFVLNANFNQQQGWNIPVFMVLPFNSTTTLYPTDKQGFESYLLNPATVIRISPSYKWVSINAGRIFPQFSELTVGNVGIWGYHVSLRPGKFVLEYASGVSQQQVLPDSTAGFQGLFKRKLSALKIGVGREDRSFFHINVSKSEDVVGDVIRLEESPTAEEGITVAPTFGILFFKKLHWKNEVALGVFTGNSQNKNGYNQDVNIPENIIAINSSTNLDFAASSSLRYNGKSESLELKARYIGPGFQTLGYPFMQSDRMEFTVSPSFRWWQNKLFFNGSYGLRINNLLETKALKTQQALVSTNLFVQINSQWSLGLNYSNFGISSDLSTDSLKIRNVSNTISVNPSYLFNTKAWQYQAAIGFSVNAFEEFNGVTGLTQTQSNTSGNAMIIASMKASDFTWDTGVNYFKNDHDLSGVEMWGAQFGAGYKFLDRKLKVSASVNPLISNRSSFTADQRLGVRLKADYRLKKMQSRIKLSANRNHYEYGSIRSGVYFTEWLYRISLSKNF